MLKKKRPVSELTRAFVEKAAPEDRAGPLDELLGRHRDKRREKTGFMPFGNLTGTEKLVDLRIREWMKRMEDENKEMKGVDDLSKKRNIIPKK